ncbi:nucleoside triphosphate pyrophosphohydrolase [Brevibacillus sp. GCM10020057]|uniref:nucleoside triphosphate pyrophosphohydrolase n=1 Tax=Brevibacillus sp. GCM10020057 TaxID=3317327 RepID=UPI003643FA82
MPIYNKLVRDLIPEIVADSGKRAVTRVLTEEEYRKKLQEKLLEEVREYMEASSAQDSLEELADVLEVVYALAKGHGSTVEELESIRLSKSMKRGGFEKRLFLHEVED